MSDGGHPDRRDAGASVVLGAHPDQEGRRPCEVRLRLPAAPADAERVFDQTRRYAVGVAGLVLPTLHAMPDEQRLVHLVRGPTLAELIEQGPAPPERVAVHVEQLVAAVEFLHDQGMAHGHLRAELIWVDGDLRLGGLGIAQLALSFVGPAEAAAVLPQPYRAPELSGRVPARPETWSDVFAVGVLVAELLTGKRAVSDVPAGCGSEAVMRLLKSATASSPSARPRSLGSWAAELASELRRHQVEPIAVLGEPDPSEEPAPGPSFVPPAPTTSPTAGLELAPPSARDGPRDFRPALEEIAHHPEGPRPPPPSSRGSLPPGRPGRGVLGMALLVVGGLLLMVTGVAVTFALALRAPSAARGAGAAGAPAFGSGAGGAPPEAGSSPMPTPPPISSDAPPVAPVPQPLFAAPSVTATPAEHARAALPIDATTPVLGSPVAPVTILVFGDLGGFQSLQLVRRLRQLSLERGAEMRIAWRHQPLRDQLSATVWTGVGVQLDLGSDAFWIFAETLAREARPGDDAALQRALQRAGAPEGASERWGQAPEVVSQLEADRSLAVLFNVRSAPTVFVNGVRLEATQLTELERMVAKECRAGMALLADGVAPSKIYPARVLKNFVGVGEEPPERHCPTLVDAPARGGDEPLVTIVEFSDFECAYCEQAQPTLDRLVSARDGAVRHVWKDLPLRQHRHARAAAALGRAAFLKAGGGAFWRVHRELLASDVALTDDELRRVAQTTGLDASALMEAVRDGLHEASLDAQAEEAKALGARGIPTYFVNGRRVDGAARTELLGVVSEERERAARLVAAGVSRTRIYEALCGRP